MINDVMQRPMFGGGPQPAMPQPAMPQPPMPQPPMPPSSVGTGITSGLVDPGESQLQAEGAFAKLAGTMGNILEQVDSAESTEEVINAIRGDQASLGDRYRELAEYVGEKDAKKTPETVLAMVQPTFTIMELVQQGAPSGGIAGATLAMGGDESPVNFNEASLIQAPGMEEAVMRMAAGEQPVRRVLGTPPTGENISGPMNLLSPPNLSSSLPYLSKNPGANAPPIKAIDPGAVQEFAGQYMQMRPELKNLTGGAGPGLEERLSMLSPYLTQTKTSDQILQEYQDLLGSSDKDTAQTQGYLALVQAGQNIAGSDKSLLGAAVDAAGEAVPALSKIVAEKAAQDRALKLAARQESAQLEATLKGQQLQVASAAIADSVRAAGTLEQTMARAGEAAINYGVNLAGDSAKAYNDAVVRQWTQNAQFAQQPPLTMAKVVDGKIDLQTAYRTQDGLKIYKDGALQPLPEGYIEYDKDAIAAKYPNAAIDLKGAQKINLLIPDPTGESISGYNQFAGYFKNGRYVYMPTGNPEEAIVAPYGYIEGDMSKILKVHPPDNVGRVFTTVKSGPNAGKTYLSNIEGKEFPGVAYALEAPVRDKNNALVSGNPLVETIPNPGIPYARMSAKEIDLHQRRTIAMAKALKEANKVLPIIGDAVGPYNTAKSWVSNFLGGLAGDGAWGAMVEFAQTERGRQKMTLLARELARGLSLSDRYAQREQELIANMSENPEGFWKNPTMSEVRFQEMLLALQNDLSYSRGVLGDADEIPQLLKIPTGAKNDPIIFSGQGQFETLLIQAAATPIKERDKFKDLYIQFTPSEAEDRNIPVPKNAPFVRLKIADLPLPIMPGM